MADVWKFEEGTMESKVVRGLDIDLPASMLINQLIPLMIQYVRDEEDPDIQTDEEVVSEVQKLLERAGEGDGFLFPDSSDEEVEAAIERFLPIVDD